VRVHSVIAMRCQPPIQPGKGVTLGQRSKFLGCSCRARAERELAYLRTPVRDKLDRRGLVQLADRLAIRNRKCEEREFWRQSQPMIPSWHCFKLISGKLAPWTALHKRRSHFELPSISPN